MKGKIILYLMVVPTIIQSNIFSASLQNHANKNPDILEEELEWIIGADVSYLDQMEDHGAIYSDMGIEKEALQILKAHWFNTIRLRLWHTPSDKYCSLENTVTMAKRIKAAGFNFLLDIHYSDTWADISSQQKPASWENLTFDVLKDSVYQYTTKVILTLKNQNVMPDIVQIGNEITHGMLWDNGRVGDTFENSQQWKQFTDLVKTGIQAVKDNESGKYIKIMIHIHCGADNGFSTWFFDNLIANGVDFDIIGLSFYTFWGNSLQQLQTNMNDLASRYQKDIVVVETAYPWSLLNHDGFPNQVTESTQLQAGYGASIQGQKKYLEDLITIVKNVPDDLGKGIVYYSPEYIPVSGVGCSWDNNSLFNPLGSLLTSVDAFNPAGVKRVSLKLNSASIPDTLGVNSFFQLRGSVNGIGPYVFPDSQVLDWSENSTVKLISVTGDYFVSTLYVPTGSQMQFKFWSQDFEKLGTNGWESGNTGTNESGDMFLTVAGDTILPLHFFNCLGEQKPYDWRLGQPKTDSIAVWFRVFMYTEDGILKGYNSGEDISIVGVRGDPLSGAGPLSWDYTKIILQRELEDQNRSGYHLFSGAIFFPKSLIGNIQKYKFFIEPNGWENGTDRTFTIPNSDTTLHWVYFSNSSPFHGQVDVKNKQHTITKTFSLSQNYPNPFNPTTTIQYSIPRQSFVTIKIYDILGKEITTLVNERKSAGNHSVNFNASDLPSGVYFYRMQAGSFVSTKKFVLLK